MCWSNVPEEDAADRGAEAAGDADGARGRKHLAVPRLVRVDSLGNIITSLESFYQRICLSVH